ILGAAATAVFRRFAHLSSAIATDRLLPRQLSTPNDRQVYANGMVIVGLVAAAVVAVANANLERLVHIYIVGVFTAIVLSQLAMVRYWGGKIAVEAERRHGLRSHGSRLLHVVAALAAAAIWVVVGVFNVASGAWIAVA